MTRLKMSAILTETFRVGTLEQHIESTGLAGLTRDKLLDASWERVVQADDDANGQRAICLSEQAFVCYEAEIDGTTLLMEHQKCLDMPEEPGHVYWLGTLAQAEDVQKLASQLFAAS